MLHVMFADAVFIAGATITAGLHAGRDLGRDMPSRSASQLHRQMLEMLLGGRDRNDAGFELSRLHAGGTRGGNAYADKLVVRGWRSCREFPDG